MSEAGPDIVIDRAGKLAVAGLVAGLASVASCVVVSLIGTLAWPWAMVGIAALPVLGLIAVGLGWRALALLSRTGVREGRGLAVIAVIVGLGSAILQGSAVVGVLFSYVPVGSRMAPAVGAMARQALSGDVERARDALSATAREAVDADRMAWFYGVIEDEIGANVRVEFGIRIPLRTREVMLEATRAGRINPALQPPSDLLPKAVDFVGDSGRALAWVLLDDRALERDEVRVEEMLVAFEGGRGVLLRDGGALGNVAAFLGLTLAEP